MVKIITPLPQRLVLYAYYVYGGKLISQPLSLEK